MTRILLYYTLLISVVVLAFVRGRTDERRAAGVCVAGTLLTLLTRDAFQERFAGFDAAAFLIDVLVFGAFLTIALRSNRFWPLWVSGLQLTATTVHLLKIIEPDLMRFVFGAALAFWSYPILLLIAIGSWRTAAVERWRSQHWIAADEQTT